jgi:SAM-dependent methyltransferase
MKQAETWKPSKYSFAGGRLTASRDPNEVLVSSRLLVDLIGEWYQSALPQHARGRLLDLGCGKVPFFAAYRDYVSEVVCVDWAGSFHKSPHLDVECDLTQDLPFGDREFDTILLSDVLEHVPRPEHLWTEMARLLAVNGKILVNSPFLYWLHETPHDYYRYTEFALRRFVSEVELTLIELTALGGAPEVLADILAKNAMGLPGVGRAVAAGSQRLAWWFTHTAPGRRVSRSTSKGFPFAYALVAQRPSR